MCVGKGFGVLEGVLYNGDMADALGLSRRMRIDGPPRTVVSPHRHGVVVRVGAGGSSVVQFLLLFATLAYLFGTFILVGKVAESFGAGWSAIVAKHGASFVLVHLPIGLVIGLQWRQAALYREVRFDRVLGTAVQLGNGLVFRRVISHGKVTPASLHVNSTENGSTSGVVLEVGDSSVLLSLHHKEAAAEAERQHIAAMMWPREDGRVDRD